jgi:hypothetical protein
MGLTLNRVLGARAGERFLRDAALAAMGQSNRAERLQVIANASDSDLEALLEFAVANRIAPIVAHALLDTGAPAVRGRADAIHGASYARLDALLRALDDVAEALAAHDIPVVALKNAGIARAIHDCRGCCPMGDIDVLIDRRSFRAAHEILMGMGFEFDSRAEIEPAELEAGLESGGTEYRRMDGDHEIWLELQWRPVAGRWISNAQEPLAEDLLERSLAIEGSKARVLEPTDNMLQVCLHTAKHTFIRAPGLRLHTDVDRLAHWTPPDWDLLAERAETMGVSTAVFMSLALSGLLLGTPIPEETLDRLAPGRWKRELLSRWLARADYFYPDEKKFSRLGMLTFHALLYDDFAGLLAAAVDTDRSQLRWRDLPRYLKRGTSRLTDLLVRYQA